MKFNPFVDEYFTRAKLVSKKIGMNPVVKYRVFGRFDGIAALKPAKILVETLAPDAKVQVLPEGASFFYGDTIMIIEGKFQDLVDLETQYLQWCMLPCYCALQAKKIIEVVEDKAVLDFAARHLFGSESVALASYGAKIGGIEKFSTAIGANALEYLTRWCIPTYQSVMESERDYTVFEKYGVGTIPHALIALLRGNYIKVADAYSETFPEDPLIVLIDYNNKEIEDSLILLDHLGERLHGVRIDTPGENEAQLDSPELGTTSRREGMGTGVTRAAVSRLRYHLNLRGGEHVMILVSSGFGVSKTSMFMDWTNGCPNDFDVVGTGSFIPEWSNCTSDIFEVDGAQECKVGREWGYDSNEKFFRHKQ